MIELVPSEFIRKYYNENGITLSDRERAAIIINLSTLPMENELAELEKIAAETADGELRSDIENFTRERRAAVESVMRKDDGYVYSIKYWGETPTLFYDFETAKSFADHSKKESYEIEKIKITGQNKQPTAHDLFGALYFNSSGELKGVWTDKFLYFKQLSDSIIPIVDPFERGDIVINWATKEIGIVETSQKQWRELIGSPDRSVLYGVETSNITVSSFIPEIGFIGGGICPIFLEKIENFDKDDPETKLLLEASAVLRGESVFDTVSGSGTLCSLFSEYESLMRSERR